MNLINGRPVRNRRTGANRSIHWFGSQKNVVVVATFRTFKSILKRCQPIGWYMSRDGVHLNIWGFFSIDYLCTHRQSSSSLSRFCYLVVCKLKCFNWASQSEFESRILEHVNPWNEMNEICDVEWMKSKLRSTDQVEPGLPALGTFINVATFSRGHVTHVKFTRVIWIIQEIIEIVDLFDGWSGRVQCFGPCWRHFPRLKMDGT